MATVLTDDTISDDGPYIIKRFYRGDRQETMVVLILGAVILSGRRLMKMPQPLALNNPADLHGWIEIGFYICLICLFAFSCFMRFDSEWCVDTDGIRLTRSSILGHKTTSWTAGQITNLSVLVTGFEKSSFLSRSGYSAGYYIRFRTVSGKTVTINRLSSRDAAARELKQIAKRLPDVACEDFRTDDVYSGVTP